MAKVSPCETCGEPFTHRPYDRGRRFCSERCRYKAKRRGERQCPVCLRGYRSAGFVQATCSSACSVKARHIGESSPIAYHRCTCGEWYVKRRGRWHCYYKRSDVGRKSNPLMAFPCTVCGTVRLSSRRVLYCSAACLRASNTHRATKRRNKYNRAMRKRGAYVEDVHRARVYERDGWVCQLCRRPVRRDKKAPHPLSATLDHIIPLAAGGTHAYANVQLAHFLCNSRKSDGDAQLRWDVMVA